MSSATSGPILEISLAAPLIFLKYRNDQDHHFLSLLREDVLLIEWDFFRALLSSDYIT